MNAIIGNILPFLSQEHQQQVAGAIERAKQVTMSEPMPSVSWQDKNNETKFTKKMHPIILVQIARKTIVWINDLWYHSECLKNNCKLKSNIKLEIKNN